MASTMPHDTLGARASRALLRLVVTLLVLALVGAVGFLLSQLNAHTYVVEAQGNRLVVMKGRLLPFGTEPYRPSDPALADAYAPIDLDGPVPGSLVGQRFTDRDELDRALFQTLEGLAHPRVQSDDPTVLEHGLLYLRRAERLSGITEEQRQSLKQMKADVAFFQARGRLEDSQRQLVEALTQLKLAAETENRHAKRARQMMIEVEGPARALEEALRRAVQVSDGLPVPAQRAQPLPPPATGGSPPSAAPPAAGSTPPSDGASPPAAPHE